MSKTGKEGNMNCLCTSCICLMESIQRDILFRVLDYLKHDENVLDAFLYGSKASRTLLFAYTLDRLKKDKFYGTIIRDAIQNNMRIFSKVKSWEKTCYTQSPPAIDNKYLSRQCKEPGLYIAMKYQEKNKQCKIFTGHKVPLWIYTGYQVIHLSMNCQQDYVKRPIKIQVAGEGLSFNISRVNYTCVENFIKEQSLLHAFMFVNEPPDPPDDTLQSNDPVSIKSFPVWSIFHF